MSANGCRTAGIPIILVRAPTVSAWLTGDCNRRVVRGGAWNLGAASLRSSDREWDDRNFGFTDRGFRVATSE